MKGTIASAVVLGNLKAGKRLNPLILYSFPFVYFGPIILLQVLACLCDIILNNEQKINVVRGGGNVLRMKRNRTGEERRVF